MKPTCPAHPKAGVVPARVPGQPEYTWRCTACGANLGDAPKPSGAGEWEPFTVKCEDTGKLK